MTKKQDLKPEVIVIGEATQHYPRYHDILGEQVNILFAQTPEKVLSYIKDAKVFAVHDRYRRFFSTLFERDFDGYAVPISNGHTTELFLSEGRYIQTFCSRSAPGIVAQILENIRAGIPAPFLPLSVIMSAKPVGLVSV